jgi:hypothetical protein
LETAAMTASVTYSANSSVQSTNNYNEQSITSKFEEMNRRSFLPVKLELIAKCVQVYLLKTVSLEKQVS